MFKCKISKVRYKTENNQQIWAYCQLFGYKKENKFEVTAIWQQLQPLKGISKFKFKGYIKYIWSFTDFFSFSTDFCSLSL